MNFNVLLDPLPVIYRGFKVNADFRTGILISQCMDDSEFTMEERMARAAELLFECNKDLPDIDTAMEGLIWFLTGWNLDNHTSKNDSEIKVVSDYNKDQWRIYSAFLSQYGINLNKVDMHFWEFMGLLSTLDECAYTRVIDIRSRKFDAKMSAESREALRKAKEIYGLDTEENRQNEYEHAKNVALKEDFLRRLGH